MNNSLNCRIVCKNGETRIRLISAQSLENGQVRFTVEKENWSEVSYVDVGYDLFAARVGDEGYLVIPKGSPKKGVSFLTYFKAREDTVYETTRNYLSVFGACHGEDSFAAFITGMNAQSRIVAEVKDGTYALYARFYINGETPFEPISVVYRSLPADADYSAVARAYRNYLLETGVCQRLSDRHTPALDYAKDSLYIRVRMAWKPVPSPVEEQTEENEPKLHVACDFDDLIRLMEDCHRAGVEKAEFCLVGWNKSGHDGRWPQIFPVEPELGGEDGLKRAIEVAKELGYTVGCHTNSTEIYSIADTYDVNDALHNANGIVFDRHLWGGGKPRKLCPQRAYEIALRELPRVKACGFNGTHYVDVLSIDPIPASCHNPLHPLTGGECLAYTKRIGQLCRELFGGYASEGGCDHSAGELDFALYVSMRDHDSLPELADLHIPLWQLVFHGIILSNPYAMTVNAAIKDRHTQLLAYEYGARPTFYFYSKFLTDPSKDWMGDDDMHCKTEEERRTAVAHLKRAWEEFKPLAHLQTRFMEKHEVLDGGAVLVTYSGGESLRIDYERGTVTLRSDQND
ncbi:MAG: hypothetical protein IJW16_00575 [Clostridia bacterium]|nr:hypothetical protein [Clostridia bacterium]